MVPSTMMPMAMAVLAGGGLDEKSRDGLAGALPDPRLSQLIQAGVAAPVGSTA